MPGRKLKDKPSRDGKRFIRSAGGQGASSAALRAQADTPVKLLEDLVSKRLDARDLTKTQRKAILVLQANGKHTSAELAGLLGVSPSLIRKDLQEIRREVGREVQEWSLEDVVGGMVLAAEKYQAKAVAQEDVALAWSIERDKVKLLKELGLIGRRGDHEGVKLTLEVLGAGYERTRAAMGRLDPALTGLVVDVEVEEAGPVPRAPRGALELDLPRLLPTPARKDVVLAASDDQEPAAELELPPAAPEIDQELEEALDQDLAKALEGPGVSIRALSGEELAQVRAQAAGRPGA